MAPLLIKILTNTIGDTAYGVSPNNSERERESNTVQYFYWFMIHNQWAQINRHFTVTRLRAAYSYFQSKTAIIDHYKL